MDAPPVPEQYAKEKILEQVADGEHSYIFSFMDAAVIDIPEFRPLQFWIPLTKFISYGKNALFCPGLFLVTPGTTNACIKMKLVSANAVKPVLTTG